MLNGAAYIRVSTDDQIEFSPDAQLKAISGYAKNNGIALAKEHIYIDAGISGKRADTRPDFMRMIGVAKTRPAPFDIILVHKFDRFARSREDSVVYKSLLRKECGVKVVSVTESIEDDKFSVILEAMLEAMAEYYSLNLADEVIKGMTEKAERGGLQTSAPYGYDAINNKLEINEAEAEIVRLIFFKFANREMSIRQIAVLLNEIGVRTKRGNLFENRSVQYILCNPTYIGKLRWNPKKIPNAYRRGDNSDAIIRDGGHEPIIDICVWDASQRRLSEIKGLFAHRQRSGTQTRTWLKGLVFCGSCGKALICGKAGYLQCNGYNKGTCSTSCCIRADTVETLVLEDLKAVFPDKIEIDSVQRKTGFAAGEYEIIKSALERADMHEKRMLEAYKSGIDTLEEYRENKKLSVREKNALSKRLEKLESDFEVKLGKPAHMEIEDINALLTSADIPMSTKHMAAHFIIRRIIFSKKKGVLKIEYR